MVFCSIIEYHRQMIVLQRHHRQMIILERCPVRPIVDHQRGTRQCIEGEVKMKQYKQSLKQMPERFSFKGKEKICSQFLIYDGDTVNVAFPIEGELRTFSVRLDGLDTPEKQVKKELLGAIPQEDIDFLKKQQERGVQLLATLLSGKSIRLVCGDFDKYNRILGTLYVPGPNNLEINVNQALIDAKLAFKYDGRTKFGLKEQIEFLRRHHVS